MLIGDRAHPLDPVFKGDKGGVFNHNFFRTRVAWAEITEELGHPGFRFHDLRASAIVMWARAGLPNYVIRDLAGHASIRTTHGYLRPLRGDLAETALAIDSYLNRTQLPEAGGGEGPRT